MKNATITFTQGSAGTVKPESQALIKGNQSVAWQIPRYDIYSQLYMSRSDTTVGCVSLIKHLKELLAVS